MTRTPRPGSRCRRAVPAWALMVTRGLVTCGLVICGLALTACSGDDADPGDTREPTVTSGTAGAPSSTDPEAVLGAYGLVLPEGAEAVTVQEKPHEVYTERYLVTLTAPAAQVEAACEAAGLPSTPAAALRADQVDLLGTSSPPADARICQGSEPADPARQRAVLFAGNPAQVWVMVWKMPAR